MNNMARCRGRSEEIMQFLVAKAEGWMDDRVARVKQVWCDKLQNAESRFAESGETLQALEQRARVARKEERMKDDVILFGFLSRKVREGWSCPGTCCERCGLPSGRWCETCDLGDHTLCSHCEDVLKLSCLDCVGQGNVSSGHSHSGSPEGAWPVNLPAGFGLSRSGGLLVGMFATTIIFTSFCLFRC